MRSRFFSLVWWILLICILALAYIGDCDEVYNEIVGVPILVLLILLGCCRLLEIYYRDKGK